MNKRRQPRSRNSDFKRLMNQEDLLAEISERLLLEIKSHGVSEEWLAEALRKDSSYVDGLVHGFANITVRELADVFSAFDKVVSLSLVGPEISSSKLVKSVHATVPRRDSSGIDRLTLTCENKYHRYEMRVDFEDAELLFSPSPAPNLLSLFQAPIFQQVSIFGDMKVAEQHEVEI